jgi:acyl-CoA thioester hydrolase
MHILHSSLHHVYAPEVDFGGIMYHANYLRFADYARSSFLNANGYEQKKFSEVEAYFLVKECYVQYKKPAKIEDVVRCDLSFPKVRKASFTALHNMYNHQDNSLLCVVTAEMVFVAKTSDGNMKPKPMPKDLAGIFSYKSNNVD